jgi:EmrB/QacA subfamily drug resistance transporter
MKTRPPLNLVRRIVYPPESELPARTPPAAAAQSGPAGLILTPAAARPILISLMFPSMLMPLVSSMSRVALPIIRTDFQLQADMTAWVSTAFALPFLILMPVYGRLSDGLGKRRLILAGIIIFSAGVAITLFSTNLTWLMAGQVIQGLGLSGMMPLGMAFISTIFRTEERGQALGTWSTVGPILAFIGPPVAGFLVDGWGWRAAFWPPLLVGVVAYVVVKKRVPSGLSQIKADFLRTFDWAGVAFLAAALTGLLFFLSSRPITGVAPLQDWRLLGVTLLLLAAFIGWEKQHKAPFVDLKIFSDRVFSLASSSASIRMFTMAGVGFLIPLYLIDVYDLSAAHMGLMLMINPGAMTLMVRFGGQVADRWGSRWPVVGGLVVQLTVALLFAWLPATTSLWVVALVLAYHGLGAGLMLAPLHRAAMGNISAEKMGGAAGLYSMARFIGAALGTALSGVGLQLYLDQGLPVITAYQNVFPIFAAFSLIGLVITIFGLAERAETPAPVLDPAGKQSRAI